MFAILMADAKDKTFCNGKMSCKACMLEFFPLAGGQARLGLPKRIAETVCRRTKNAAQPHGRAFEELHDTRQLCLAGGREKVIWLSVSCDPWHLIAYVGRETDTNTRLMLSCMDSKQHCL